MNTDQSWRRLAVGSGRPPCLPSFISGRQGRLPLRLVAGLALALVGHASAKDVVVTAAGAVADGTTVNTKALQAVIDRMAAEGGGTLVVPKGVFLSGALFFKQGVNLRIEKDGVLKSTTTMADFPPVYTRWEGIERYWTPAFLNFIGMKKVQVSGDGLIDGSGDAWANFGQGRGGRAGVRGGAVAGAAGRSSANPAGRPPAPAELPKVTDVYGPNPPTTATINFAPDPAKLPPINAAGVALPRGFGFLAPPRALMIQNCDGVRVSGLHLKNNARWGFVFLYSENVVAENLTVHAEHYIPSSDGMDIDSCRHMLVTGCEFDVNDDCISIKSGKDEDGRRVNRPCEDIVIEKTRFDYGHGGAAMGSETSGGIRNVEVRDCIVDAQNWAPIRIKTQPSRGGVVEDITYRNIEIRDAKQAFEFDLEWNMRINVAGDTRVPPTVRNVKIINVHGTVGAVGKIHGLKDSFVDGVKFENCDIKAKTGLVIDNARNIDVSGLKATVAEGEPIIRRDAAMKPSGDPARN
jgi:exo-poly-alpha-galacturonosidase